MEETEEHNVTYVARINVRATSILLIMYFYGVDTTNPLIQYSCFFFLRFGT